MERVAAFDGVRGLSILSVFAFHAGVPFAPPGTLGVDVFFVLSGLLITGLIKQQVEGGGFSLRAFYVRRLRRLTPPLAFMLAVCIPLAFLQGPAFGLNAAVWGARALTYVSNLACVFGERSAYLQHTWTLAMEGQFYLLWPVLLPLIIRTGKAQAILAGMAIVCVVVYSLIGVDNILNCCNPAALIVGSGLAYSKMPNVSVLSRTLSWAPLTRIGLLSYGIYLWHFPLLFFVSNQPWWVRLGVIGPLSIALAALSYVTVERWAGCARQPLLGGQMARPRDRAHDAVPSQARHVSPLEP